MREIDEAVRQDDAVKFFQKYGVMLGGAFALLIAGMLAYWYWESGNETTLEGQSETLISALDSADAGDLAGSNAKAGELLDSETAGAKTAAQMLQASNAMREDDTARASELYAVVANDAEAPQPLRDLALVREVSASFDQREPADVIAKLEPLAKPGNPFFGSAGELVAMAHMKAGNKDQAGALFAAISKDESLPASLRNRAQQMAGFLGVDVVEDVDEVLESQGLTRADGAGAAAQ